MSKMEIKLIKSTFYNEKETKEKLCNFIMDASYLSMWIECKKFEENFSKWQWRKYSVLVNSWSSANLALIQALINIWLLDKNDKIWFSWITWATNVMPLIQLWLNAIPIDVEMETLNISLNKVKESHTKYNLKAIFITNLLGFSDDIESIANYCKENNILIIEDNCESLWSELKWKKLWNFSIASTFSFFVWHHMSCIEWWIISTDDKALYNEFLKVRAHWWDRNLDKSSQEEIRTIYGVNNFYSKYTFYDLWYNIRPTEITWFLWNLQINFLDEIIDIREKNFNFFHNIISKNNNFYKLNISLSRVSNFAYPIICKDKNIFNKYLKLLNDKNIEVRPIVWWLMTEQPFFKKYNDDCYVLENSKLIHELWFYFWNNPELTIDELDYIVNIFKND